MLDGDGEEGSWLCPMAASLYTEYKFSMASASFAAKNVCDHLRVVERFGVAPEYTRRQ